jgi:hypothetical protein
MVSLFGVTTMRCEGLKTDQPVWGTVYAAMAVTDVFLAKAVVVGLGKVAFKAAVVGVGKMMLRQAATREAEAILAEAAVKGAIETEAVGFTQSSIKQTLSTGENLNEVIAALKGPGGEAMAAKFKPIRVFVRQGKIFTLDNRRLAIFAAAGRSIPFVLATEEEVAQEAWKFTAIPAQRQGWFIVVR